MKIFLYEKVGIEISDSISEARAIQEKFYQLQQQITMEFIQAYRENVDSVEMAILFIPKLMDLCISVAIEAGIRILASQRIYSYDVDSIFTEYSGLYDYSKEYDELVNDYSSVLADSERRKINQYVKENSRKRWVGGGFGIAGALKGAITAGAMNIASDVVHFIPDQMSTAANEVKTRNRYDSIYQGNQLVMKFADCLSDMVYATQYAIIDIINKEIDANIFNRVFDTDSSADTIFENYCKYQLKKDSDNQILDQMAEIIILNPMKFEVYALLYEHLGSDEGLLQLAEYTGIKNRLIDYILGKQWNPNANERKEIERVLLVYDNEEWIHKMKEVHYDIEPILIELKERLETRNKEYIESFPDRIKEKLEEKNWAEAKKIAEEWMKVDSKNVEVYLGAYRAHTEMYNMENYVGWIEGNGKEIIENAKKNGIKKEELLEIEEFLLRCFNTIKQDLNKEVQKYENELSINRREMEKLQLSKTYAEKNLFWKKLSSAFGDIISEILVFLIVVVGFGILLCIIADSLLGFLFTLGMYVWSKIHPDDVAKKNLLADVQEIDRKIYDCKQRAIKLESQLEKVKAKELRWTDSWWMKLWNCKIE